MGPLGERTKRLLQNVSVGEESKKFGCGKGRWGSGTVLRGSIWRPISEGTPRSAPRTDFRWNIGRVE